MPNIIETLAISIALESKKFAQKLKGSVKDAKDDLSKVEKPVTLKAKTAKFLSSIKGAVKNATKLMVGFGVAGAAAVAGIGVASLKMAGDFEAGMREVNSMMGLSEKEFQKMSSDVLKLSSRIGVDAVKMTAALYQAISAGVPEENVLEFMEIASKAAIAGVTETEVAVDGLTTIINAFKLPWTDAQRVADVMFTTVKGGKTTIDELSKSMFNVAPIAAALGLSIEEVTAAMATMTKQGVPTTVVSTQLRQVMVEMLKPGKELAAVIKAAGYESGQAMLDELGLQKSLQLLEKTAGTATTSVEKITKDTSKLSSRAEELKNQIYLAQLKMSEFTDKTKESTKASARMRLDKLRKQLAEVEDGIKGAGDKFTTTTTKAKTIAEVFSSVEAGGAALALTGENVDMAMSDLAASMDASGAATEAFNEINKGINRQLEILRTKLKNVMIMIGMKLLPVITPLISKLADGLGPAIERISTWVKTRLIPAFQTLAGYVRDWIKQYDVVNRLKSAWQGFMSAINNLKDILTTAWEKFNEFFSRKDLMIAALVDLTVAFVALGVAAVAALIPIVTAAAPILAAIVGIGAAALLLAKAWNEDWLGMRTAILKFVNEVKVLLGPAIEGMRTLIENTMEFLTKFWKDHWDSIRKILEGVWKIIQSVVQIAWAIITGIIKVGLRLLAGDWEGAWEEMKSTLSTVWEGIKGIVSGAISVIEGLTEELFAAMKDAGIKMIENLWAGIQEKWGWLTDNVKDIFGDIRDLLPFSEPKNIRSPLRGLGKAGHQTVKAIGKGMESEWLTTVNKFRGNLKEMAFLKPQALSPSTSTSTTRNVTQNIAISGAGSPASVLDRFVTDPRTRENYRARVRF